jgi:hypothetical protein
MLRFRCHTGHAFSVSSLLAEVTESIEQALWSTLRGMEDVCSSSGIWRAIPAREARARLQCSWKRKPAKSPSASRSSGRRSSGMRSSAKRSFAPAFLNTRAGTSLGLQKALSR